MTTTRKIRLAALVALANGVLFLSFGAPPCEAGKDCIQIWCSTTLNPDVPNICWKECLKCGDYYHSSDSVVYAPTTPYYCAGYAAQVNCYCKKCPTPNCAFQ